MLTVEVRQGSLSVDARAWNPAGTTAGEEEGGEDEGEGEGEGKEKEK